MQVLQYGYLTVFLFLFFFFFLHCLQEIVVSNFQQWLHPYLYVTLCFWERWRKWDTSDATKLIDHELPRQTHLITSDNNCTINMEAILTHRVNSGYWPSASSYLSAWPRVPLAVITSAAHKSIEWLHTHHDRTVCIFLKCIRSETQAVYFPFAGCLYMQRCAHLHKGKLMIYPFSTI